MTINQIISFALGPLLRALLGFILLPILTWYFPIEDLGKYAILQLVFSFSLMILSLGMDQAFVREYFVYKNKHALFKLASIPSLMLIIISLPIFIIFSRNISVYLFDEASIYLSLMVFLCILFAFVNRFVSLIFRMEGEGYLYSLSLYLSKIAMLIIVGMMIITNEESSFINLISSQTFSLLVVSFVLVLCAKKYLVKSMKSELDIAQMISMLRFGSPLIAGSAAYWGLTSLDKIFLKSLTNFEEVGIYSVCISFAAIATIFQTVFSTMWMPAVYKWSEESDDMLNKVDEIAVKLAVFIISILSLVILFTWIVDYILPPEYSRVKYLLVTCMVFPLLYTLSEVTVIGINLSRKTHFSMLASIISLITNIIGNLILIPKLGAAGAAISTAISFGVFFITRTEFSIMCWQKIPRLKIYLLVLYFMIFAISYTLLGYKYEMQFKIVSLITILLSMVYLRPDLINLYNIIIIKNNKKALTNK
jgi:O-antigen/teichoic acid export membrane protein